jgi:eukaryotic-like serine/threonine-protein kinase
MERNSSEFRGVTVGILTNSAMAERFLNQGLSGKRIMVPSPVSPCPDRPALERLLLGCATGPEAEALEVHLAGCTRCVQEAETLTLDDPLVQSIHEAAVTAASPHQELIDAAVPLLKRLRSLASTVTMPPRSTGEWPVPVPELLGPPESPAELDRLGPYQLLRQLGAGGMGVVYLAEDPELKRQIALKAIRPELVARAGVRERFLSEARAVAAVEHDHIVAIHHVGEHDGVPFLAMPLLRGQTLEDRLREAGGALPVADILRIGRETAEGLAAAHGRGLVHRDVKPSNLFLESSGRVKILDFGLAQVMRDDAGILPDGTISGTPGYMAPEQGRGEAADAKSDLFSLGCVLYRMATGRHAFRGADAMSTLMSVAIDLPPSPVLLNPELPAPLASLIERLLAKQPVGRPTSALEVAETLRNIENARADAERPSPWRRRWVLGAAAAVAAMVLTAWLLRPGPVTVAQRGHGTIEQAQPERLAGEVRQHKRHSQPVRGVAMSPRAGSLLALSVSDDRQVVAWDAGKDDDAWTLGEHQSPVHCVCFSADGRYAASGSGGKGERKPDFLVRLWDVAERQELAPLVGHESWVTAVAFSPDGRGLLSGGADGSLNLWDLKSRQVVHRLRGHDPGRIYSVAFSADGKQALSGGGDKVILLWNVATGRVERRLEGHAEAVTGAVFAPDGTHIASSALDGMIRVWDLRTGEHREFRADKETVHAIASSPDGKRLLSAGEDGTVRLWDADRLEEIVCLKGHRERVHSVAFAADGRFALSGSADRTVRLWELPK